MSEALDATANRPVGARDIPLVLLAPRRLFRRVEDVGVYAWPLVILLTVVTLIGYATVQTGLIDRGVDRGVRQRINEIDRTQRDVVERSALRELYQQEYELGEFMKLMTRIQVVVAEPAKTLAAVLLVSALFYGVVALTGRKPEWHTLLTISVFAGFIDALRLLMTLVLMLSFETLQVDTSLALLTRLWVGQEGVSPDALAAATGLLSAADPFRIWYWLVLIVGLRATAQLPGWRAWLTCSLCWLVAGGVRCGLAVAAVQSATRAAAT